MFTVIAAEQQHLDSINVYKAFLSPFMNEKSTAFCRWYPDGKTLEEAIPELNDVVSRHEQWRLIAVCPTDGLNRRNPFDLVSWDLPLQPEAKADAEDYIQDMKDFFRQMGQCRKKAYVEAAEKPLARLGAWLCEEPMISSVWNEPDETCLEDAQFMRPVEYIEQLYLKQYRLDAIEKARLREAIRGAGELKVTRPAEMICLAMRCCDDTEGVLCDSWKNHEESQYSRFCDRNLYYDRMRFLTFDILPQNHRNYTFDYIRFLYCLMLLGAFEVPQGCLAPNRVYKLECENNEQALRNLLQAYDDKLTATQDLIRTKKNSLKFTTQPRLTDRDAEVLFCSSIPIPVSTSGEFDTASLSILPNKLGLSSDCPAPEMEVWTKEVNRSENAFRHFLKQPRRAVNRAAATFRQNRFADLDLVGRLNRFQQEDVAEHTGIEELKMIDAKTRDIYQAEEYEKRIRKADRNVQRVIEGRMSKKMTILLGVVVLALSLLGMLPALFSPAATGKSRLFTGLVILGVLALLAGVGLICLVCLRLPLKRAYSDYNGVMHEIVKDVSDSMQTYSDYLSHACNVMRGNSVLNFLSETEDPTTMKERILEKHLIDVERTKQELYEIFGPYLDQNRKKVDDETETFDYDFERAVDYTYPLIYSEGQKAQLDFLQTGNIVEIPVNFVRRLSVRREELYE